jgi:two-component system, cell cycle sensor histidine kinase and response regulator CckA
MIKKSGAGKNKNGGQTDSASNPYEAFFEQAVTCLVMLSSDCTILRLNNAWTAITGLPVSGQTGKSFPDCVGANDHEREELRRMIHGVITERKPAVFSSKPSAFASARFGRAVYWDWVIQPVTGHGGEVEYVFIELKDVSSRIGVDQDIALMNFAMQSVRVVIILFNEEGKISFVNAEACRLLGYSREEFLQMRIDRIDPDFLPAQWKDAWGRLRTLRTFMREGRLQAKNGMRIPVDIHANYFEYKGNSYNLALVRDATDRIRVLEELRASEARFSAAFRFSPIPVAILRASDNRFVDVNEEFLKAGGFTRDEVIGQTTASLNLYVAEADRSSVLEQIHSAGFLPTRELKLRMKSGEIRTILSATTGIMLGGERHYLSMSIDITERKKAEDLLRKFQLATEQSPASIVITDIRGLIEYVNPKFTEVTGYTAEEVIGANPRVLKSGEMPADEYRRLWQTISSGQEWRGEFHNRKKDGALYWELASISPIRDDTGEITHFVAVKEDITERKRAAEELHQTEVRSHNLEMELLQSQKLRSLGTLASGIAHDFNNILNIIVGHADLLEPYCSASAPASRSVDRIQKAAMRGTNLIRQLLTLARKGNSVFQPVSIAETVDEFLRLLTETFPRTITIGGTRDGSLPPVRADANQIHQVLLNLAVNARDAMPDGGTLTISTRLVPLAELTDEFPRATAPRYVCIMVSDTGSGMNEEVRHRMFEPFFTTKEPGRGTGLGLAQVYSIIENHRGMIGVDTTPAEGTAFRVYLPVEKEGDDLHLAALRDTRAIPGGMETILVIEDEPMIMEMLRSSLSQRGYTILSARDGEEGVEQYAQNRDAISVVLSDLGLPKITGEEVCRRIVALNPAAKVIIASGFVDPKVRDRLLQMGVSMIVQKPYKTAEVLRVIRTVIDTKG